MALWVLTNDCMYSDPGSGPTVLKAGKTIDDSAYNLATLRAAGANLTPYTASAVARATQLQGYDRDKGQHGGTGVDSTRRIDAVSGWLPSNSNATTGSVTSDSYTALASDSLVEAAAGTTVNFYGAANLKQRLTVKNISGDASQSPITLNGNGANLEDPNTPGAFGATFALKVKGGASTWEYDGTQWALVS